MPLKLKIIKLQLPYHLGSVNSYLIETAGGYFLIDTGSSNQRSILEKELESVACQPGNLKLIIITHGDFDHTGNTAYLRAKFGVKVAMHQDDSGMVEHGDMFWNRKNGNFLIRLMGPALFGFGYSDRFKPDVSIGDEYDLAQFGLGAKVLSIPGHSCGSIGILTVDGDLFCGDLLDNTKKPAINAIMDDLVAAHASIEKLKGLGIKTVYPGHGNPFPMEQFMENHQ